MPSQELARQAAMIRQFVAFVYRLIIRLIPHRLIPRTKSFSWKLAVPRPPAVSTNGIKPAFYFEYHVFDRWIANTRENTGTIVTEVPRMVSGGYFTYLRPRIASWGYAPPPSPSSSDDSRNY